MANKKITDLTELNALADDNDYVVIVDVSDTTHGLSGTTKKIKKKNVSPKIRQTYANLAALVADQANQNTQTFYRVTDSTGFTLPSTLPITVTYLGTTNGDRTDYQIQYTQAVDATFLESQTGSYYKNTDNHTAPTVAKATPVGADLLTIWDSAASFIAKKLTFTNLLSFIKSDPDRLEETNVTTTKNIDWSAYEVFKYVMTGNTTFSDINLPSSGSKTITLHLSGNFTPTYPTGWNTYVNGTYDGTVLNTIVVQYVKAATPFYKMQITQPD